MSRKIFLSKQICIIFFFYIKQYIKHIIHNKEISQLFPLQVEILIFISLFVSSKNYLSSLAKLLE